MVFTMFFGQHLAKTLVLCSFYIRKGKNTTNYIQCVGLLLERVGGAEGIGGGAEMTSNLLNNKQRDWPPSPLLRKAKLKVGYFS